MNALRTVATFLRAHPVTRAIPLRIPGDVMAPLLPLVTRWDQNGGGFESFSQEIAAAREDGAVELGCACFALMLSLLSLLSRLSFPIASLPPSSYLGTHVARMLCAICRTYNNEANLPDQPLLRTRAFALSLWNASLPGGALCWWSVNYWGPGWGSGASGPNSWSGTVLFPPQPTPSSFLPVSAPQPRSSLRWEALLDGLFDLERATLLHRWSAVMSRLPQSAARESALAMAHSALKGVQELVWTRPLKSDLTVQPFATAARAWLGKKEAMEDALEALAAVGAHDVVQ